MAGKGVIVNPKDEALEIWFKTYTDIWGADIKDTETSGLKCSVKNYIRKTVNKVNPYTLTVGWFREGSTLRWGVDNRIQFPTLEKAQQMQKLFQQITNDKLEEAA